MTDTTEPPRVTLAVIAYNQERFIREAIEGAFAQTYQPLEIILSDDCSSDRTHAIMQDMAAAYDGPHRVVLNRNERNLGIVAHNRRTWEISSGQLVVACAGDDIAKPHRIARLAEAWLAGEGRVMAVHSKVMKIDPEGRALEEWAPVPAIIKDASPLNILRAKANCIGATAAWDRGLLEYFGQLSEHCLIEDGPWFFRAALLGEIAYIDETLVQYRVGGISERQFVSPGYDFLRGDRMKFAPWRVANARSFLHDMEKVDFPEKAACQAECRGIIDKLGFEVELWQAPPLKRIALLPSAIRKSFAAGNARYVGMALRQIFPAIYIPYRNFRKSGDRGRAKWLSKRFST